MKFTAQIVTALFFLATGFGGATAAVLKSSITVETDVVRLGDLFVDSGAKKMAIVAAAPAPGAKIIFSAARLQSIARRAGLAWRPQSRHEKTVVTRTGRLVSSGEISGLVQSALIKEGMPADFQIALSKNNLTFHIAPEDNRDISIQQIRFNRQSKQFSAIVAVPEDRTSLKRVQVTGSVYEVMRIPVLARSMQRGEAIRESDLDFIKQRRGAVGRNTIMDVSRIVGKTPRRYLQTGKPIRITDLRMPILVAKGKLVTLTLKNQHMLITATGKALEDGAKGDVIRVTNTRSRQTVQGVVVAPNRVAMNLLNGAR
jgi:flagella basal body P-ring formation protein FlgA